MIPAGTRDPKTQGAVAKAQPTTKLDDPILPCVSCSVSIAPFSVKLCDTTTRKELTATGTPSGGTFSWSSADASIATVSGAGRKAQVKGAKPGKTKINVTYSVSGCTCASETEVAVCVCTPGRKYAYGYKNIGHVVGVRAKIKVRYGKICCEDEGCSTQSGYHVVYANISNTSGTLIWAQSGFGRERKPGSTSISKYRYAEMKGATYKVSYDTANAPSEGSVHLYQCELDNSTGKWTYSEDGGEWQTFADNQWKNKTGTSIQYTGEIFNKEDDMPGTDSDACKITECQYLEQRKEPAEEKTPSSVLSNFGFDKSGVTPEQAGHIDAIADQVWKSWKSPPEIVKIRLVGHTDPVGSAGYNIGLGQRRALAVRGALVDALEAREGGLSGKVKITTESRGESQLVDGSGTEAGNAKNRRVEVFLTTKAPPPDWKDAGLAKGDVKTDDAAEWGAEWVSGTALHIWDKHPLP